jgi:major membrane immunogen (membrane-anchored lipoprotein)
MEESAVFNLPVHASFPWQTLTQRFGKSAKSTAIALGLAIAGIAAPAMAGEAPQSAQPIADGVYLYGQSQTPEQIGSAYMVFEVTQGKMVGAFYMPRSSFDCFHGNLQADRAALTVVDSYSKTSNPYDIAYSTDDSVAMAGDETIAPLGLEGFHRIDTVSANDQRLLATCKADL